MKRKQSSPWLPSNRITDSGTDKNVRAAAITQNAKLLRAQAQISQITSAPEAAAMKVKGMPMRMKSPVETL